MSIYDKASLVLIPSGTKTSKVYSQKPVNGDGDFTFSRSTAATRVNADGNIEKETQNLLLQSNTFDTTWLIYMLTQEQADKQDTMEQTMLGYYNVLASARLYKLHITYQVCKHLSVYAKQVLLIGCVLIVCRSRSYAILTCNGTIGADKCKYY